jgi:hypothetical protein
MGPRYNYLGDKMTLQSEILADNAIGYWKLDETSGGTAVDTAGGFGNGTYTNGPALGQSYLGYNDTNSKSVDFDGTNDYMVRASSGELNENFTIEAWINADSFSTYPGIFGGWTANSNGNYGSTVVIDTSGYLEVYLARTTWNAWEMTTGTGYQLSTGVTYHIVLTTSNTASPKIARLYVNGSQVWSSTYTNNVGLLNSSKNFRIGAAGSIGSYFNGRIDDVAVYHGNSIAPLSAARVAVHYNAGLVTTINAVCPNIGVGGNKKPSVAIIAQTSGTPNKLHASGDYTDDYTRIAGEGWTYTSNGGTPHYTDVDETTVDYNDYITYSGTIGSADEWYVSLYVTGVTDPQINQGHILRYAYKAIWDDNPLQAGVDIYSGVDLIGRYTNAGMGLTGDNNGDPIIFQVELPSADAALINDYNDLYFVPFVKGAVSSQTIDFKWYWFEFEVPQLQVTGGIANLTNINVNGIAATISTTSNVTINAPTANVSVIGSISTISITNHISISAGSSNILINGQNVTINTTSNAQVESSPNTINVTGHNVSLITGISFLTTPEEGLITVNGSNTTISIINPITVNAPSSNIAVDAKNTSSSYYNTVDEHNPIHWWRLTEETSPTSIADDGSSPISGTSNSIEADYVVGIPGAWSDGKEALILGGATSPKGIKFNSNPIANNSNITLEFWIKPQQTGQNASAFVNYFNDASTGISGTYNVRTTIGLYQGKVCVANIYYTSNGSAVADITTVSDNITINQYNHVVLTKSTSGATSTYKSYINGQETATPLSIGTFFYYGSNNITYQSIGTAVDSSNAFIVNPGLPGNTVTFDEFAVYDTALPLAMVQEHYSNGRLGPLNAIISVDHTNIYLQGIPFGTQASINAPVSNINISGRNPTLNVTGSPTIITNSPNIAVNGKNATFTNSGSRIISVQKSNINIKINLPKLKTRDAEFIFINKNDVSLSANDATEINGIDFGGLLYNQIKKDLFKIGNTSDFICSFNITVYSKETQVISAVKLSTDNINYSDTIYIENIGPNQMSDNIYVKFDVNALDVLGPGTFLINVEQIYVL